MATNEIGSMSIKEKVDEPDGNMLKFLIAFISAPADKDEHDKDVTTSGQYQGKLKAYQVWFKRNQSARYTLLSSMHDDLLEKFEHCPTANDIWDQLKIKFW